MEVGGTYLVRPPEPQKMRDASASAIAGRCVRGCVCVGCAFAPANAEANSPVTGPQPTVATVQRNRT